MRIDGTRRKKIVSHAPHDAISPEKSHLACEYMEKGHLSLVLEYSLPLMLPHNLPLPTVNQFEPVSAIIVEAGVVGGTRADVATEDDDAFETGILPVRRPKACLIEASRSGRDGSVQGWW